MNTVDLLTDAMLKKLPELKDNVLKDLRKKCEAIHRSALSWVRRRAAADLIAQVDAEIARRRRS